METAAETYASTQITKSLLTEEQKAKAFTAHMKKEADHAAEDARKALDFKNLGDRLNKRLKLLITDTMKTQERLNAEDTRRHSEH